MSAISVTAANVAVVDPDNAEIYSFVPAVAFTRGQVASMLTTGKVVLADADDTADSSSRLQPRGIALEKAGVRAGLSILKRGKVAGFDLSALAYGAKVYLSTTAGALDTAQTGTLKAVGQVVPQSDSDLTKVLYVEFDWTAGYA